MSYDESIADMIVLVKTNMSGDKNVASCYASNMDALHAVGAYLQTMRNDCRVPLKWIADVHASNVSDIRHMDEIAPQDMPKYRRLVQKDIAALLGEPGKSGEKKVGRWENGENAAGVDGFFRFLLFVGGDGGDIMRLFSLKNPTVNKGKLLAQKRIQQKYQKDNPHLEDEDVIDAYTLEELDEELDRLSGNGC
jgi:hypothetical protein